MTIEKTCRRGLVLCGLLTLVSVGCSQLSGPAFLDSAHAPKGAGWRPLFNGEDLTGWQPRTTDRPLSWTVVDGVMVNTSSHEQQGIDIVSDEKFCDFEIYYEYNVPPVGNSGVYLRGRIEIQICDNEGHPKYTEVMRNGALYSLIPPSKQVSRPAGEWQSVYAKIVGQKVTVVLNGEKVIDGFEVTRATGAELDRNMGAPGPIMLQGNHSSIEFRNLYVRPLKCRVSK